MRLALADRTGTVVAVVWDDVDEAAATAAIGEPIWVIGTFAEHPRDGRQIVQLPAPSRSTGSVYSALALARSRSSSAGSMSAPRAFAIPLPHLAGFDRVPALHAVEYLPGPR